MEKQIDNLYQIIGALQAQLAATESLLTACIFVCKDDPRFLAALAAAHNSRMAGNLNTGVSDKFITDFESHLVALTPQDLRKFVL